MHPFENSKHYDLEIQRNEQVNNERLCHEEAYYELTLPELISVHGIMLL